MLTSCSSTQLVCPLYDTCVDYVYLSAYLPPEPIVYHFGQPICHKILNAESAVYWKITTNHIFAKYFEKNFSENVVSLSLEKTNSC